MNQVSLLIGSQSCDFRYESATKLNEGEEIATMERVADNDGLRQSRQVSRASLVVQRVKSLQCRRLGFDPWVRKIPWRRKQQPTPVFLPGKSHGWCNLVGYSPWGHKEADMTERLHFHFLKEA